MSWLIWRELAVVTRTAAWWACAVLQALFLAAFIATWGDGVPVWPQPFFEQFTAVHLVFLALTTPWLATRVVKDDATSMAMLALITVEKPARLIIARAVALLIALAVYALTALPMTLIAMRISALTPGAIVDSLLWPLALCGLVAVTVGALSALTTIDRVAAWLLASATALAVLAIAPRGNQGLIVLFVATATMIGVAVRRADRRLRYVGDVSPTATR
jgi:hypothetical protein